MNEQDNGGGFLGTLLVGMGLAGIVLAPFYIAYRFGAHVLTGALALIMTWMAIFSGDLVAMARDMQDCGYRCLAAPGANLILTLDQIGWWKMVIALWLMTGLMFLARGICHSSGESEA